MYQIYVVLPKMFPTISFTHSFKIPVIKTCLNCCVYTNKKFVNQSSIKSTFILTAILGRAYNIAHSSKTIKTLKNFDSGNFLYLKMFKEFRYSMTNILINL